MCKRICNPRPTIITALEVRALPPYAVLMAAHSNVCCFRKERLWNDGHRTPLWGLDCHYSIPNQLLMVWASIMQFMIDVRSSWNSQNIGSIKSQFRWSELVWCKTVWVCIIRSYQTVCTTSSTWSYWDQMERLLIEMCYSTCVCHIH